MSVLFSCIYNSFYALYLKCKLLHVRLNCFKVNENIITFNIITYQEPVLQ